MEINLLSVGGGVNIETDSNLPPEKQQIVRDICTGEFISDDYLLIPTIDGPPGTGKTFTATIVANNYVREKLGQRRVIFLAYTNYALDRVKEELDKFFDPKTVIRLRSDTRIKDWERGVIGCDIRLSNLTWNEQRIIREQPFLICTPFTLSRLFRMRRSPREPREYIVVVDEFSQIDPATFLMALNTLRQSPPDGIILFGDPLQLPVVTTQVELLPNIVNFLGDLNPGTYEPYQLFYQFRMHESICSIVNIVRRELSRFSRVSRGHELRSAETVKRKTLSERGYRWNRAAARVHGSFYEEILDPDNPVVIVDTTELSKDAQSPTGSWYNRDEAELAVKIAKAASDAFTTSKGERIFPKIITPYSAQSLLIKSLMSDDRKNDVLTVYKAQGREYPFVVVSFVRNNEARDVGFLTTPYLRGQAYVAISRAQSKLIVLISEETFGVHPVFDAILRKVEGIEGCIKRKAPH